MDATPGVGVAGRGVGVGSNSVAVGMTSGVTDLAAGAVAVGKAVPAGASGAIGWQAANSNKPAKT